MHISSAPAQSAGALYTLPPNTVCTGSGPEGTMSQDEPEYEDEAFDDEVVDADYGDDDFEGDDYYEEDDQSAFFASDEGRRQSRRGRYRDEVFSKRVPAGKRTYFFDVKSTRSGEDYFLTITESKKVGENRYEKHKLFLYKEDFGKFVSAMHDVVDYVKEECLPDYEFRGLPEVSRPDGEQGEDWSDEEGYY